MHLLRIVLISNNITAFKKKIRTMSSDVFIFQECFPGNIHVAYIIKPEKFWEKKRTSVGSAKYNFEVSRNINK